MTQPRTVEMPENMHQLNIGELIDLLSEVQPYKHMIFDFGDVLPGDNQLLDCYHRHPNEIAIRHRRAEGDYRMTSAEIIIGHLDESVDCTFIDHLGQERTMSRETPLWAANWKQPTGNAIVGLVELRNTVIVRTWHIE